MITKKDIRPGRLIYERLQMVYKFKPAWNESSLPLIYKTWFLTKKMPKIKINE